LAAAGSGSVVAFVRAIGVLCQDNPYTVALFRSSEAELAEIRENLAATHAPILTALRPCCRKDLRPEPLKKRNGIGSKTYREKRRVSSGMATPAANRELIPLFPALSWFTPCIVVRANP
jgi:hypothetical protein